MMRRLRDAAAWTEYILFMIVFGLVISPIILLCIRPEDVSPTHG